MTLFLESSPTVQTLVSQLNDNLNTPILLILPRVDPARHLSDMPDTTSIADLILPGTHESMARYGCEFIRARALRLRSCDEGRALI